MYKRWIFCLFLIFGIGSAEAMNNLEPCSIPDVEGEARCGFSFNRIVGCVDVVIADFISKGSVESLDFSCASKIVRPPFAVE